ncbi:Mop1: adehyde oxidoreductase [Desulfosarcina variabilis str. Montpellier]|uniref:molybdopterin-dependent oxidoreductase n=1 Tax=Desulfosarcina variabilis TaxID=2300 RepID=UPI003AFAEE7A
MKKVQVSINGAEKQFVVDKDKVLLDLLREDLRLTGAKQSCDRKGQCGACTVIVDGKAKRSCLVKVADLDGAQVISVEGLGTPDNPHLIQEAFVLAGAIQCGFCTPGMIMTAKALLDQNNNPSVEEIKKAFARNLCRCTGYAKIIDAVVLAGRFLRGETTPDAVRPDPNGPKIGVSHPRPSAMLKACGLAQFAADIPLHNPLEIAMVLSTEPHATLKSIDPATAEKMPGVAGVMTAKDIKGTNRIKFVFDDEPVLCDTKVRRLGDPIAIVAAETKAQALAAAQAVTVDYDPLPVMMTPEEALAEGAVPVHDEYPNLCWQQPQIKGDAEKALAEAAAVVEAAFSTQMNHQAPLEPEVSIAYLEGEGEDAQLVVMGRSIMIHTHMAMLQGALGWENMRYEEPFVGGQFGIKAAIVTEAIVGAAALHFKRPVRYVPSLEESMLLSNKRHPFAMKVKLAADKDGKLTAYVNDFVIDNGAYQILGIVVGIRALQMLSGSYDIPNVKSLAKLVYTNNAPGGAARGAGPPQVAFALESAMDMLADKLGIDPLDIRIKNSLAPGGTTSVGATVDQWPFVQLCEDLRPYYEKAKVAAAAHQDGSIKRGVGLACNAFGVGEPGDNAMVAVELDPDDGITIYAAAADPGEGNDSMLTQIGANLMNLSLDKVRIVTRSTDQTTETGPAAGSRITFMVGGALVDAIEKLKAAMADAGVSDYNGLVKADKPLRYIGKKNVPDLQLDPETGQGGNFDSQIHNIQMAEVEVNTDTGEARVLKITTAVDPGVIIHPQNLEMQLDGGIDQGVGYALREQYVHGKTKDWLTFKFPTMKTTFDIEVLTPRETPRSRGPLGATGIGEMTMVSTAPAVVNAIANACGARVYHLPATPEKVKAALEQRK